MFISILVFFSKQTNLVFCWYFCVTPKLNKLEVAGNQIKSKINSKQGFTEFRRVSLITISNSYSNLSNTRMVILPALCISKKN